MATGTVKFFNAQKGFGFIVQDGGGPDVFVHISAVERAGMSNLNEGQKLTFDIVADRKNGKSAADNLQAVVIFRLPEKPRACAGFFFFVGGPGKSHLSFRGAALAANPESR